ncbi:MAG: tail fiber domain-containing protein, partial [Caulobacteraceae bacterium]|nr:tail fiber domain-containing protein [Caulobacteraceae bacterium]
TVGTAIPGTATIDLVEIRLDNGRTQAIITDSEAPTQYGYGVLTMTTGQLYLSPNEAGTVGANPRAVFNAQNGQITLDASKRGTNGSAVSNGSIRLAHDITNGKVWFGGDNSTRYEDTNLYRNNVDQLRTDDRFIVGDRTSPATSQVDAQGVILDAASGYAWIDRSPNDAATDASLFLSSGYFNGNLQMVRLFRKITSGGTALSATGHILVANNTTTAPSFGAGSDWRLKSDVRDASDEINFVEKINNLRPVLYTETGSGDENLLGFIAHEVQAIIPNAVEGAKDAVDENGDPIYQMLYPAKFIPYLVGAVRELSARVEALEARLAAIDSME